MEQRRRENGIVCSPCSSSDCKLPPAIILIHLNDNDLKHHLQNCINQNQRLGNMSALTEKQQREWQGSRLRKRSTTMATSSHQQLGQRLTQRPRCSVFFYLRVPASAKDVLIKHWQKLAKMGYARVTTLPKDKDLFVGRSASTVESQQATCANTARPFTSAPR